MSRCRETGHKAGMHRDGISFDYIQGRTRRRTDYTTPCAAPLTLADYCVYTQVKRTPTWHAACSLHASQQPWGDWQAGAVTGRRCRGHGCRPRRGGCHRRRASGGPAG